MGKSTFRGYKYYLIIFILSLSTTSLWAQPDYDQQAQFVDSVNSLSFQYLTTQTEHSLDMLLRAEVIADSIGYLEGKAEVLARLSGVLNYLGHWDESTEARLRSIKIFEELGLRLKAGYGYAELGWSTRRRDYERAEYFMMEGLEVLKDFPQSVELSNAYNNFGIIKLEQGQVDSAQFYVEKSLEIKEANNDTLGISYSLGYLGSIFQEKQDYDKALEYLLDSYELKSALKDTSGMAIDLTNIASNYDFLGNRANAISNYRASLNLALAIKYHHLAEHNFNQLSALFERSGQYDSALVYQKMYNEFYQNRVDESTDARLAELEVEFETELKENELALQKAELSATQLKIRNRNWILAALGSLFIFGGISVSMFIKQQKNKQRENELKLQLADVETQNRIHKERERISRDLHDNVGAQITSLISGLEISNLYVENNKTDEAIKLIKTLDSNAREAMGELRETIWLLNRNEIPFGDFTSHLKKYVNKQAASFNNLKMEIISSIDEDLTLNPQQSLHLLRIVQEALTNCLKYADATCFEVRFFQQGEQIILEIKDDGKGETSNSSETSILNGNGLMNMKRRAEELDGLLQISQNPDHGFSIKVEIPFAKQSV